MEARQNGKKKARMILFGLEIVIILGMLAVLYLVLNQANDGPRMLELNPEVLEIHEEVRQLKEEGGTMLGYRNIALFGLDAETDSQL